MRKGLALSLATLIVSISGCSHFAKANGEQAETATYFRAWQGFKKPELTTNQFLSDLVPFMSLTTQTYPQSVLNNYIVVVPPITKPSFIPDEFALVALKDEASYRAIRATAEGQAYGEAHWQLFDKTNSKSAQYQIGLNGPLVSGTAYDLSPRPLDWSKGVTLFFLGTKKSGIEGPQFLEKLRSHIELASKILTPAGMDGYIVIANENYEAAFIHWKSQEALDAAFATNGVGAPVGTDANTFMDVLMWSQVEPLKGTAETGVYSSAGGFDKRQD